MTTSGQHTNFDSCEFCDKVPSLEALEGWYGRVGDDGVVVSFVCADCYDPVKVPGHFLADMGLDSSLGAGVPLRGNFQPVKSDAEIIHARTDAIYGPFWLDIEDQAEKALADYQEKVLRFSVSSYFYKGIQITPHWSEGRITLLEVSGTNASNKLQLNIYQTHRLTQMGFVVGGDRVQTWKLTLQPAESDFANIARVISHVLEFGYMIRPARFSGFTITMDIDSSKEKL